MSPLPSYVLVTPARDEAAFIELTLKSVVAQTVRPSRWVIVSDGSTDGTDQIVARYAAAHPWIELLRMPARRERDFAGKARAFSAGYAEVKGLAHDVVGSLDADASFEADHYEFLLERLVADPALGVVGTAFTDDSPYDYRFVSIEHVAGISQLFRRQCFEAIGGYQPLARGGVDHVAVISARMKGWKTRTFTERTCQHHRNSGAASHGPLLTKFRVGVLDYTLGGHPLWEAFRVAYQTTRRPFVAGAAMLMAGYVWAFVRRLERPVSRDLIEFRRREQMQRLRKLLTGSADNF